MDGSRFASHRVAFDPTLTGARTFGGTGFTAPRPSAYPPSSQEPAPEQPGGMPDREWSLSAGQVVAAVLLIIAACELIGLLA